MKNKSFRIAQISLIAFVFVLHSCVKSKAKEVDAVTVDEMKIHLQYNSIPDGEINSNEDFKKSNLVNADNVIDDANLRADLKNLEKESPIAIYYTSENKTQEAARILDNLGFKQIYILNNGIIKWKVENQLSKQKK